MCDDAAKTIQCQCGQDYNFSKDYGSHTRATNVSVVPADMTSGKLYPKTLCWKSATLTNLIMLLHWQNIATKTLLPIGFREPSKRF